MMVIGQSSGNGIRLSPAQQELRSTQEELQRALTIYSETNPRVRMLRARVEQLTEAASSEDATEATTVTDPTEALFDLEMEAIERLLSAERKGWPSADEIVSAMPEAWKQTSAEGKIKRNRERDEFLQKLRDIRSRKD